MHLSIYFDVFTHLDFFLAIYGISWNQVLGCKNIFFTFGNEDSSVSMWLDNNFFWLFSMWQIIVSYERIILKRNNRKPFCLQFSQVSILPWKLGCMGKAIIKFKWGIWWMEKATIGSKTTLQIPFVSNTWQPLHKYVNLFGATLW